MGDAAQIRASYVRKQKTDRRDAEHILKLLLEGRFPRLWMPDCGAARSAAVADSSPQAGADTQPGEERIATPVPEPGNAEESTGCGVRRDRKFCASYRWRVGRHAGGKTCWSADLCWTSRSAAGSGRASKRPNENPQARLLMTQPGVGPITALAFVLTIGDVTRFPAQQTGSQLSGTDSARAQLGRAAKAGRDQQARQQFSAHAAGGSGADRVRFDSEISQTVFASLPQKPKGSGQSGSGAQVSRTTLLDATHQHAVSRDRSHREQPAGAPGRRKLDRRIDWALSHPARGGMFA